MVTIVNTFNVPITTGVRKMIDLSTKEKLYRSLLANGSGDGEGGDWRECDDS